MGGSAREFRYTEDERQALAAAVPDPNWPSEFNDWQRLVTFAHYQDFRLDKVGFIARTLERMARECLAEEKRLRTAKKDAEQVRVIARAASKLREQLMKPTPYGTNFALAFLPDRHKDFLDLLDELILHEEWVDEIVASWHADNVFTGRHHPAFTRFVDAAITLWRVWTDTPPGASKEGGPAARFLCAAVNPVIAFEKRRRVTLRRGGLLTLEAAGQLIEEVRRID